MSNDLPLPEAAVRSVIVNQQTNRTRKRGLVLYPINTTLPRRSGVLACISSRITTGIHVVLSHIHRIDSNCFNEPSADSLNKFAYS